jgi:hypothetical protein
MIICNTKTDRAFENIFASGGVIFLRPAAFKKPRWRFAFLRTLLRMIVKKTWGACAPRILSFWRKLIYEYRHLRTITFAFCYVNR